MIYEKVERLMGDSPAPNKELEDFKKKFNGRSDLWSNFFNFSRDKENWKTNNIRVMDS